MITLSMACGHPLTVKDDGSELPICPCGERRVTTVHTRAPKFRGICHGPHATYEDLPGLPVRVTHESGS